MNNPLREAKIKRLDAAFTLLELIITLCVFSIVIAVAFPSFTAMIQNKKLAANSDTLVNALNYARNTALNEGMNVQVCPLGVLGTTGCGGDWRVGWIVVAQPASGINTLLKSQQLPASGPVLSSSAATVLFDSHGIATTQSNFKLCDDRGAAFALSVGVLATGYVQSGATPGQAVWNNGILTCP